MTDSMAGPTGDTLFLNVQQPAVSLQSKRKHKDVLTRALREELRTLDYLYSGEVSVTIEWLIHERLRYETLTSPDVDNIIKVVLDALSGPAGVMINDCQVQHVSCNWIDTTASSQSLLISVRPNMMDDWVPKRALVFVRLLNRMCWPLNLDLPPDVIDRMLSQLEKMVALNQDFRSKGMDWYTAQSVMPIQQPFHSGRLRGFEVLTPGKVRARTTEGRS